MFSSESMSLSKRIFLIFFFSTACFYLIFFKNVFPRRIKSTQKLTLNQKSSRIILDERNISKTKIDLFLASIHEEKFYTKNNLDGVILSLIKLANLTFQNGYYVEIGLHSFLESPTRVLNTRFNWHGLMMDENHRNSYLNLQREKVYHSNVLSLFSKYNVPNEFDLLIEHTDYADYWIIEQILTKYKPKMIVHQVNKEKPRQCVTVPKFPIVTKIDKKHKSRFYGASVCAFRCLARVNNFTMVYCESTGESCFWVRNDYLSKTLNVNISFAQDYLNPKFLYRINPNNVKHETHDWVKIKC